MPKEVNPWAMYPRKTSTTPLPEALKREVTTKSLKIESYHKEQNKWIYETFEATDDITLHSLDAHFSFADAYTDVGFEETTGDTNL